MMMSMEAACYIKTCNSFSNATILDSSILVPCSIKPRFPTLGFKKRFTQFPLATTTLGTGIGKLSSVTCCSSLGSSSAADDNKAATDADWRTFRARLVAGERASRPEESTWVDPDTVEDDDNQPQVKIEEKWAHPLHEPERGCLLIATEKLDGVHIFERTVILLLSTGPIGPTGIILNRPSLMSIKETGSRVLGNGSTFSDRPLFFGGPLEEGFFLLSPKDEDKGASGVFDEVMKGLYYGTKESIGCAAEMVKRKAVGLGDFRFFDGYCGWESEQLKDEIKAGFWTVAACSPSAIGLASVGRIGLWEEILGLMGQRKVW